MAPTSIQVSAMSDASSTFWELYITLHPGGRTDSYIVEEDEDGEEITMLTADFMNGGEMRMRRYNRYDDAGVTESTHALAMVRFVRYDNEVPETLDEAARLYFTPVKPGERTWPVLQEDPDRDGEGPDHPSEWSVVLDQPYEPDERLERVVAEDTAGEE